MKLKSTLPIPVGCLVVLMTTNIYAATHTAYANVAGTGNQAFSGNLGLNFVVNSPGIFVTQLGAFNSTGVTWAAGTTIKVGIFTSVGSTPIVTSTFNSTTPGTLVGTDRFLPVTPTFLAPGNYIVVAVGFNGTDMNGNTTIPTFPISTEDSGGGLITFVSPAAYDTNTTLDNPTPAGCGSCTAATNEFEAGTFQFTDRLGTFLDNQYLIRYATNYSTGVDSQINIINTGANGNVNQFGPSFGTANSGSICVNVYALDPQEELLACCSCLITPNQVVNLAVNAGIVANLLTPEKPTALTIKLIGSAGPTPGSPANCNNEAAQVKAAAGAHGIVGGFLAFGTTAHAGPGGALKVTETPFLPATLSTDGTELLSLATRCSAIVGNGSKFGQCPTCNQGALGAANK